MNRNGSNFMFVRPVCYTVHAREQRKLSLPYWESVSNSRGNVSEEQPAFDWFPTKEYSYSCRNLQWKTYPEKKRQEPQSTACESGLCDEVLTLRIATVYASRRGGGRCAEQEEHRGAEISIQHIGGMKTLDGQKRIPWNANSWPA
jgi:hypothetical protein